MIGINHQMIHAMSIDQGVLWSGVAGDFYRADTNRGVTMRELNFRDRKRIRNRLLAIFRENGKVTERDLLRLSALTGINYSSIVEVHKSTRYEPKSGFKGFFKGRAAGSK